MLLGANSRHAGTFPLSERLSRCQILLCFCLHSFVMESNLGDNCGTAVELALYSASSFRCVL